jgi:hypothetical protein
MTTAPTAQPAAQPAPVNTDGTVTRLVKLLMRNETEPLVQRIAALEAEVAILKGKKR